MVSYIYVWKLFTQYGFWWDTFDWMYNCYTINLRLCRLLSAAIENTMNNRNSALPIMESQPHWKRRLFNQYKTPSFSTIQKTHQSC